VLEHIPSNQLQLYSLIFNYLSPIVESIDDLGSLTGYSVIRDLVDLRMIRGPVRSTKARIVMKAEKELKLDELGYVYSGFEKTITEITRNGVYESLASVVEDINSKLEGILANDLISREQSVLFKNILTELTSKSGNYEEKLRRKGLLLLQTVRATGALPERSDFIGDYETIEKSFVDNDNKKYFWHKR